MGKIWKILLFVFIVLLIAVSLSAVVYPYWARRLIYPSGSKRSDYPGVGEVIRHFDERILVNPKTGRPFFAASEKANYYRGQSGRFEVTTIPAQDQLLYAAGRFLSWQEIEGSVDKYLVVRYPDAGKIEHFRVSFEASDLFGDNETGLFIENTGLRFGQAKNPIKAVEPSAFIKLSFAGVEKIIKSGDAVVIIPVAEPPKMAKKDGGGIYLARSVVIRRAGGKI